MRPILPTAALLLITAPLQAAETHNQATVSYGPRPAYLIEKLPESDLKTQLQACATQTPKRSLFSIGHRGAPLMFPEHTVESNVAAAGMGAGILECDVTFTKDLELVCRHAQNDLHTSTDILTTDLASTCITPFQPATNGQEAQAECRTSEITLEEFRSLRPKMDGRERFATTPEEYQRGDAPWRSTLYADDAQSLTHAESIALFKHLGAKFTPELKAPAVVMPFHGFTQNDYAQKLVDEYKSAGIPPANVYLQSFDLSDILYWIKNEPEFGAQAIYLDDRYGKSDSDEGKIDPTDPSTFKPTMAELKEMGVNYIAPPIWMLLTLQDGEMAPSPYAHAAKEADLKIIAWSLDRSGPLTEGGGWYYRSVAPLITNAGSYYSVLHTLAQDVGVSGVFSDWPATVTYYANCMGLD